MRIDWIIPCRFVEIHDNLGTLVGAGSDTYWVAEFPAPVQVFLAMRFSAMQDELGPDNPHTLRNLIRDTQGNVLSEMSGEIVAEGEQHKPEYLATIMLPTIAQFEAAEEGTYMLESDLDGETNAVPIHVLQGPPRAPGE
ncbi:MAG: hypothetical protein AABM43_04780 [Actinomycetota bacterium]